MGHWKGSKVETHEITAFLSYVGEFSKEHHDKNENNGIVITPKQVRPKEDSAKTGVLEIGKKWQLPDVH
jgi:hypothetical protein